MMQTRLTGRGRRGLALMLITPLLLAASAAGQSVFDQPQSFEDTLQDSVVMIRSVSQDFNYVTPWKQTPMAQGVGSGFIIEGNRILTNAHNVANNKYVEVKKQNVPRRYPAIIMHVAHDCDLALLTVLDKSFFENTEPLEIGDIPAINSTVQTYGFPVGGRQISVTEGVVSRVQMGVYSHSQADSHLVVQTDAAINPGNSGGPVIQDRKVVGVAFQGLRDADNIGYMIPATVIRHFLKDVEDGRYDEFGSLGFTYFPGLHNEAYARWLNLPEGVQGVVVLSTVMHSSVENVLERNDVISRVGEYDIDNDGMIHVYGRTLHFSEAIEQAQIGDTLPITFYRDGEKHTAEVKAALNRPVLTYSRQYDLQPRYLVYAGLTFVPVTRNYLEVWGSNWVSEIPFMLRYLFSDSTVLNDDRDRKEYVVLSQVLPDEVNAYAADYVDRVVKTVNEVKIQRLEDLPGALKNGDGERVVIRFMDTDQPLVLDAGKAAGRHAAILEKYNVPSESNLEEL